MPMAFWTPFPVFFPSENIVAVVNEIINGADTKWRLKKSFNRSRIWSFWEAAAKNKKATQSQNAVLKHTHQNPSFRILCNLACRITLQKLAKAFVVGCMRHKKSTCPREAEFLFEEKKYNSGKCFVLRYFSHSKNEACHVCKGKDLSWRQDKGGYYNVPAVYYALWLHLWEHRQIHSLKRWLI